jgi:hypothetical protein
MAHTSEVATMPENEDEKEFRLTMLVVALILSMFLVCMPPLSLREETNKVFF